MKKILAEQIEDGMVLDREVCGTSGNTLLTKGTKLSAALGRRLQSWGISFVYIEGVEEQKTEETVEKISTEELKLHLDNKFSNVLKNPLMHKIFNAIYEHRLKKADGR